MKRKIFISMVLAIMLICIFAVSVCAKEYSPKNVADLNAALTEINSSTEDNAINLGGDGCDYITDATDNGFEVACTGKLTINLLSDISVNCRFLITSGDAVFNLNSYTMTNEKNKTGENGCQFFISNEASTLYLYNGTVYINDVCFWFANGNVVAENVTIISNEEMFWEKNTTTGNSINLKNCTLNAGIIIDYTSGCSDKDGVFYEIEGCTVNGAFQIHCPTDGSTVKNCTVNGSLAIDSWHKHNSVIGKIYITNTTVTGTTKLLSGTVNIVATNCKGFADISIDGDGTVNDTHMEVVDCTYTSIKIGTKSSKSSFTVINTATCISDGSRKVYTSSSLTETIDEAYASENPALGHSVGEITGVHYDNYFEVGTYYGLCSRCAVEAEEATPSAPAFVTSKGVSRFKDGETVAVTQGFTINKTALNYLGNEVDFGIIAAVNLSAEEIAPQIGGDNTVSASLKNGDFVATNIKLVNVPLTDADTKLVFCMYLSIDGTVYYLNNGTTGNKIIGLSYNDVAQLN